MHLTGCRRGAPSSSAAYPTPSQNSVTGIGVLRSVRTGRLYLPEDERPVDLLLRALADFPPGAFSPFDPRRTESESVGRLVLLAPTDFIDLLDFFDRVSGSPSLSSSPSNTSDVDNSASGSGANMSDSSDSSPLISSSLK